MNGNDQLLGIVNDGKFQPLATGDTPSVPVRLTRIPMQASQPPESAEINLAQHEGQAIMVRGRNAGGWVYSATVIDQAGPILTAVVQQVFGQPDEEGSGQVKAKVPKAAV